MKKDPTEFRKRFLAWKDGKDIYDKGRPIDLYLDTMERVAKQNASDWGVSEDISLINALNDNTYNYRGYYDKYPESSANSRSHWSDEFKTVYHPTFSNESQYHGKKSLYNPYGLRGGMWIGNKFQPASWLSRAKAWRINKLGYKDDKDDWYKRGTTTNMKELVVKPHKTESQTNLERLSILPSLNEMLRDLFKYLFMKSTGMFDDYVNPTNFMMMNMFSKNTFPIMPVLGSFEDGKDEYVTSYDIPYINDKAVTLTNAGLATGARLSTNLLDSIADNAVRALLPIKTAIGLATKESTLGNPTDDRSMRTLLSPTNAAGLTNMLLLMFGLSYDLQFRLHINKYGDAVREQKLINYYRTPVHYDRRNGKSVLQKAFEFYKESPRLYNPGQRNHPELVDKRANEVWQSPEVQEWWKDRIQQQADKMKSGEILKHYIYSTFKHGKDSGIHIKPSKRGTFTAAAKRRGMSVSELESAVLNNPGKYSKSMRKKAQFSRNARKWKH